MSDIIHQNYSNFEATDESDLGYGKLLGKLWRRRLWFAGVFTGVLAISLPLAFSKQPVYQSYMQILVEPNYQKNTDNNSSSEYLEREFADSTIQVDYETQLKVFKSATILNQVAERLVTIDSDDENYEATIDAIASSLKESLSVYQVLGQNEKTQTKIIQANYVGSSPAETKKVLEAIQKVYVEYNLEQQEKRLRDALNFVDNQIPKAQQELRKAEVEITELSKDYNLISPQEDAYAIKQNIRQLAQQRSELKAQQSEAQANVASLQEQLGLPQDNSVALSRLSQSPRYQNLLNKLQETEILLATERQKFTDDNPIIQTLINERDSQKALLEDEAKKVLGGEVPPNFLADIESLSENRQLVGSDTNFVDRITESQSNLTGLRERDRSLAQTKAELEQQLSEFPELIARYKNLTQRVEIRRQAVQRLLQAKQELEIELSRGGFNWQIIEPAQLGVQIAPNLQQDLLLNLVLASFLGLTAAFIRETIDQRISNTEEIISKTELPLLGATPKLSASKGFLSQPLSNSQTSSIREVVEWQPFREAIDMIYENLRMSSAYTSLKTLAITSAIAEEGKSTFTLGLALTVARHQHRVLIIDADFRNPSLHDPFNLSNESGLSDYLASKIPQPAINKVTFSGETIDIITSGTETADPVKLLSTQKLNYFIEQQKLNYDLILVDTPPVLGTVDAVKVASICSNTVVVTRLNKVKVSELLEATAFLSNLKVMGIVANDSKKVTKHYKAQSQYLLSPQT